MPNYFLTIRAHVADVNLFEDFILFFLKDFKPYCYSIELDSTPDRHLHCIINNVKDFSTVSQKLNKKFYKEFKSHLNLHSNSKWIDKKLDTENCGIGFINYKSVSEDEVDNTIGYIFKDNASRRDSSRLTESELLKCIKLYYASAKLRASNCYKDSGYKILSAKTAPAYILDFCKRNDIRLDNPHLLYLMAQNKIMSYNVPDRIVTKMLRELRIGEQQEFLNDQEEHENIPHYGEASANDTLFVKDREQDIHKLLNILSIHNIENENIEKIKQKYAK